MKEEIKETFSYFIRAIREAIGFPILLLTIIFVGLGVFTGYLARVVMGKHTTEAFERFCEDFFF